MGMSTFCILKPMASSAPLDSSSCSSPPSSTRPTLAPRKNDGRISWGTKQMIGLACTMIISLEITDLMGSTLHNGGYSMASELAKESQMISPKNKDKKKMMMRFAKWSEKRVCPQWHFNSLETIVPENLPRPLFHRKSERVSYSSRIAPLIKSSVKIVDSSCFSL